VPQAEALDELLKKKHMKLDAVVELRVNESALLQRVETRVAEMRARGEEVRIDDTPEVLVKRLASYRQLTEPLIHYYSERRKLLTVDGMMNIEHVTREIGRILAAIGAVEPHAPKKAAKAAKMTAGRVSKPSARAPKTAKMATKAARKAAKVAARGTKKPLRKSAVAKGGKSPKVTKKRAKR
jgi:adenylate kinase